jgi:hypothetical protein
VKNKGDRLLHGGADKADIECDYAIGPFDRMAIAMDRKWGIDRLPTLVSPETAAKYGSAVAKLNAALEAHDPKEAVARAGVCVRGMQVMDAEAEAAGHQPAAGDFWEAEADGFKFGILADASQWQAAREKRPDLIFFSLREVALAMKARCETAPVAEVKETFPGAEISGINPRQRTPLEEKLEDEIPW